VHPTLLGGYPKGENLAPKERPLLKGVIFFSQILNPLNRRALLGRAQK